jgi:hypothetical protein
MGRQKGVKVRERFAIEAGVLELSVGQLGMLA